MQTKTIHIAILISNQLAGRGGLESVLDIIDQKLAIYNITVTFIFLIPPKNKSYLQHKKHITLAHKKIHLRKILPKFIWQPLEKKIFNKRANQFLKKTLFENQFDALLTVNFSKNFLNIIPSLKEYKLKQKAIPIIAWPHGTLSTLKQKEYNKFINTNIFDYMFAISHGIEKEFSSMFPRVKSSLVYNPITKPAKIPTRCHNKFIIMARVNDPNKRIIELLTMMSNLSGSWTLDVYGDIGSKNQTIKTHALLKKLKLETKVTLHGWNDNPWNTIESAGILLLNSLKEGMPMCLLEATSRGIPCISSNCPTGPSEIIINDINGWLYEINDEQKGIQLLQKIINKELKLPPQNEVILSVNKFTEEVVIKNFTQAIYHAINEKNSTH